MLNLTSSAPCARGGFCDDIGPALRFPEQSRPTELAGTVQSTIV
jgi:hypothetical protein